MERKGGEATATSTARSTARWSTGLLLTAVLAAGAAACGGGDDGASALSEAGQRGKQIATAKGCAGCHGLEGQGGVGPTWQGLAGSEVELADGTVVRADDEYLVRSITDPGADLLADFAVQMPRNDLNDSEVADIVAYIKDLGTEDPTGADG